MSDPARIHNLLDEKAAASPEKPAIIDFDGRVLTYSDWATATDDAVAALREAGVGAGDRVMVVAENAVAFTAFVFACSRLDAWVVPVNARFTVREVENLIDHSTPAAIIFTSSTPAAVTLGEQFKATAMPKCGFGQVAIKKCKKGAAEPVFADAAEQVAALIYTTGTTGAPKGVMLTHNNLLYMARTSMTIRAMTAGDHVYGVLPFTHIFAFATAFLAALRAGAKIELATRFDPPAVFAAFRHGVSLMPAVPAMYALMMEHAEQNGIDKLEAPALRYISSGGAPLDPDWKRRVEAFFGCYLHNGYGLTESSPGIAATAVGAERDDTSCGLPMPGQDVRIVPAPGQSDLQNDVGEIVVKGPNVMKGYYRDLEETAKTIDADGFLHTGDLGYFSADGALFVVGRCKELIIRSGFNVYPPEVEAALNRHADVTQAYVVGKPQEDGNEQVLAFVQCVPGASSDEAALKAYLTDQIAPYKRPARIIITDTLPAAATGKVLKHKLIETFADQLRDQ